MKKSQESRAYVKRKKHDIKISSFKRETFCSRLKAAEKGVQRPWNLRSIKGKLYPPCLDLDIIFKSVKDIELVLFDSTRQQAVHEKLYRYVASNILRIFT